MSRVCRISSWVVISLLNWSSSQFNWPLSQVWVSRHPKHKVDRHLNSEMIVIWRSELIVIWSFELIVIPIHCYRHLKGAGEPVSSSKAKVDRHPMCLGEAIENASRNRRYKLGLSIGKFCSIEKCPTKQCQRQARHICVKSSCALRSHVQRPQNRLGEATTPQACTNWTW